MPDATFQLVTLGRLALIAPDGSEVPSLSTRRRKLALLAVLAIGRRPVERDRLVELFWGDQPEDRARHSLSDALSHLRRVLGAGAISTRRAEVELAADAPLLVDLLALDSAAKAQRWGEVVSLYGGPFLEAVHVEGSPRWEQWVAAQRTGAEALFRKGCAAECARLAAAREWGELASLADRWLEVAPLEPDAGLALLNGLSEGGEGGAESLRSAEAGYHRLVRRLSSEFESPPAPALTAAAERISTRLRAVPASSSVTPPRVDSTVPSAEASPPRVDVNPPSLGSSVPKGRGPRMRLLAAVNLLFIAAIAFASWRRGEAPAIAPFPVSTRSAEARALYDSARAAGERGEDRRVQLALFSQAIRLDSSFAMAYRQVGSLLNADEASPTEVRAMYESAMRHLPSVTPRERQLILGEYHTLITGDYARAAQAFRELLALAPEDARAWYQLATVYQYVGDDRRAAEAYRESARYEPLATAGWLNLIDAEYAAGDTAGAARSLAEMARRFPGDPALYTQTHYLALANGDYSRAEQQASAYLASTGSDPRRLALGHLLLSRALWSAGRLEAGDAAQREAVRLERERGERGRALQGALTEALAVVWLRGDQRAARTLIAAALTEQPLDALPILDRPYLLLATALAVAGRPAESVPLLEQYRRLVPAETQRREASLAATARGTTLLMQRRFEEAVTVLESARDPLCPVCGLPELGLAYSGSGREEDARRTFERYLATPTLRRADLSDALHRQWISARLAGQGVRRPPFDVLDR